MVVRQEIGRWMLGEVKWNPTAIRGFQKVQIATRVPKVLVQDFEIALDCTLIRRRT
jgi:hypothetical protein